MNDVIDPASNALATLSPEARAQNALGFSSAQAELAALATKSAEIVEITNKAGYDQCHASRMVLKNKRLDIQNAGKAAREDAQAYSKAVIGVENQLISIVSAEEERLQALQAAWDAEREREKAEAARVEAERVQKQKGALAVITGSLARLFGASVDELELAINQLEAFDMDQFDIVFRPDADKARDDALSAITRAKDERIALDAQAAELKRQQEEHDRQQAEAAEQRRIADEAAKVERDRLAAEAQAKADAEAEDRRAAQALEDAERAERLAAEDRERARVKAEQDARQAELDKQANEQRERDEQAERERQAEAQAAREEEEQQAAAIIERERQEARDRHERETQELDEALDQKRQHEIDSTSLFQAATWALEMLVEEFTEDNHTVKVLAAALAREPQA